MTTLIYKGRRPLINAHVPHTNAKYLFKNGVPVEVEDKNHVAYLMQLKIDNGTPIVEYSDEAPTVSKSVEPA